MPRAVWVPGSDHGLVWSGGAALLEGSVSPMSWNECGCFSKVGQTCPASSKD